MSEEMLDFIILYTWKVYQKMLIYNFVFGQKQYDVVIMAYNMPRQMLLAY